MWQVVRNKILIKKGNFILFALSASFFIHVFIFSLFFLYIEAKGSPVIFFWPVTLNKNDFLTEKKQVVFPPWVKFSSDNLSHDYFLSPPTSQSVFYPQKEKELYNFSPVFQEAPGEKSYSKEETEYVYLWERPSSTRYREEEAVSYKVLVSPNGKIILSFPEKLALNSYGNLVAQEYLRESVFSLKEKFFWTKLEGVVK